MKEYVLVEFFAKGSDREILNKKLASLGTEFEYIKSEFEYEHDEYSLDVWDRIYGRISSEFATQIKLQDSFLAERMRVSYIPDELKDKYRR